MAKYTASYEFPQDPDCIYGILSEVERMSEFMPMCKRSQVLSRQMAGGAEVVRANFLLRYRQVSFELDLDLQLTLWPSERRIKIETTKTKFGSGSSQYIVTGVGRTGSRVQVETDYKFRNLFVHFLFGRRLIRRGMDQIMDRVRQRAETLAGF